MPYTIEYDERTACVVLVRSGTLTIDEAMESGRAALQRMAAEGTQRMLIDNSAMTAGPSIVEMIRAVNAYLEHQQATGYRFAIVVPEGSPVVKDMRTLETVARNRRLDARIATSRDEALAWLAEGRD